MKAKAWGILLVFLLVAGSANQAMAQIGALGAIGAVSAEGGSGDLGPVLVRMAYPMGEGEANISYIYGYTKYTKRDGEPTMTSMEDDNVYDRRIQLESSYYTFALGLTDKTYISSGLQFGEMKIRQTTLDTGSAPEGVETSEEMVLPVNVSVAHVFRDNPEKTNYLSFISLKFPTNFSSSGNNTVDTKIGIVSSSTIFKKYGWHNELSYEYSPPHEEFNSGSGSGASVDSVDPGDTISWNFAFSYPTTEKTTVSLEFRNFYRLDNKRNEEEEEDSFQYASRMSAGLKSLMSKNVSLIALVDTMLVDETAAGYYYSYLFGMGYTF